MNDTRSARLAVLIDADNASAKIADGLFEEIAKIGEASVRRIYGDFSTQRMKGWTDILARHAIIPHQQFAYTTGKNASDITLVIDAMDLLHSGRFDGFCLVSSDSDFTRLASRIREQGVNVFGFGEQKTPESFRQACRRFIYTENLLPQRASQSRDAAGAGPIQAPLREKADALPMLSRVIDQMESEDGWVNLGTFGKQLQNLYTDFDPRTYGERKLSDLVRRTNAFEINHPEGGSMLIRLKQHATPKPAGLPAAPVADKAPEITAEPIEAPKPAGRRPAAKTASGKPATSRRSSAAKSAAAKPAADKADTVAAPAPVAAAEPSPAPKTAAAAPAAKAPLSAPEATPARAAAISAPLTPKPVPIFAAPSDAAGIEAADAVPKPRPRTRRPLGTPRG
ncbi:hypothetical protein Sa4125_35610 [Aureimonas sp. SA4125]|nr:hypothetical protein Sa4125_35610 [Aureimonas sp. SA4125]